MRHERKAAAAPPLLAGATAAGRGWRRAQAAAGAVALLCFAAVPFNEYCYDSKEIVERSPLVHEPGRWLDIWTTDYWFQGVGETSNRDLLYRPVAITSYRIVAALAGPAAAPQHAVNVALHMLAAVLVVRLGRRFGFSPGGGAAAGVIFAALPIHTEVVADVVGRAELLATIGVIAALLAHRCAMDAATRRSRIAWRTAAALTLLAAMGAKESGVAGLALLPVSVIYWHWRRDGWRGAGRTLRAALPELAYLIVPAVIYFGLRYVALGGQLHAAPAVSKSVNVLVDAPGWQRVLGAVQLWGMYWSKTFYPAPLCIDYSISAVQLATSVAQRDVLLGAVVAVALVLLSVIAWRRERPEAALLSIAVVLAYLPASNVLVLVQVFFAERIWYLPSVFVALLLGLGVAAIRRPVGAVLLAVALMGMTARCWVRSVEWRNNEVLYAAAYRDHPQAVGVMMLRGQWLAEHGQYEEGVRLIERALTIDYGLTDAHRALGVIHVEHGDHARALTHLMAAEQQFPGHPRYRALLEEASAKVAEGAEGELAALRAAADERPADVAAELGYARRLLNLGRFDDALSRFAAAEARFAASAPWQHEYAVALASSGRTDDAIDRYRQCHVLAPDNAGVIVELGSLLLERRRGEDVDEAERLSQRAIELAPQSGNAGVLRAEMFALRGDIAGALAIYDRLITSAAPGSPQRIQWEGRAKALGRP